MEYRLAEIAEKIGATLEGEGGTPITGVAEVAAAGPTELCFAEGERWVDDVRRSEAGAVIVPEGFPPLPGRNLLRMEDPRLGFLRAMELFVPPLAAAGIHPRAVIAGDAQLGEGVSVEACAVVGSEAHIGERCRIGAGAVIGPRVHLGPDCSVEPNAVLHAGVTLGARCTVRAGASIGGEGFGFHWLGDHHHPVPQLGGVELGDDVELGCNSCVDRATLGATEIGDGTKIDNLVQVGHNDRIGRHVVLVSQVGLSGSVEVGDGAMLGGQAGVKDHVKIGAGARVTARAGVMRDVPEGGEVAGFPARARRRMFREQAALARLPEALRLLQEQQRRIEALEERLRRLTGEGGP